jgi:DNA-directed RNA polymerase subunit M/transcription elongation factor TFIIS
MKSEEICPKCKIADTMMEYDFAGGGEYPITRICQCEICGYAIERSRRNA